MGSYDKYYEFKFLADFADTSSTLVRDFFLNVNYIPELQLTVGQFVEPFAQEHCISAEFNDFIERGLTFLLYPSPTTCRSPGVMLHGDFARGVVSYWAGAFNGRGTLALNTTSQPEIIGRLRISPFRGGSNDWLKGLKFGGSVGHSRLSNERSFDALAPAALRAEYVELHQSRRSLDVGQTDLPRVLARAVTVDVTCLITGEQRPEYGQPKPLRPFLTPQRDVGTGAIELKARYSYLWARALGDPVNGFPTIQNSAHEVSFGINWYPSYLVRYMLDLNIYKVNDGTTAGAALPQTFPVLLQRFQVRM